jgi:AGZA family xanthine/uracil permease-like MFS transporter
MKAFIEKYFKIKENGTSIKTEVMAGITTFLTMAYIIALNPNLIAGFDASQGIWKAIFLATVISSAAATIMMGVFANKPFALAPGMGLNSYFATVCASIAAAAGVTFVEGIRAGLCIILLEGIIFIILSLFKIREKIVEAIPGTVRLGISAGIGLMLVNIGLGSNDTVLDSSFGSNYMLADFFGQGASVMWEKGIYVTMVIHVLTLLIGIVLIAVLAHKNINGAILYGVAGASVFYWVASWIATGVNPFASLATASWLPPFADMAELTLFKFNFGVLFELGYFAVVMTVLSFCIVDMFDTIGTLYGTCKAADMLDENDNVPDAGKCLLSDAVGTCVGAITGTSTVTSFVESAAGVKAGGRTGLTSVVTGLLFLACMFISPIAAIIPAPATSAALVYVGALMINSLREVDYSDAAASVPVVIMLIAMPVTGSIGSGIGLGLVSYSLIKICRGEWKDVSWLTVILSALFVCKFFIPF